jgi:hypothetical protein
METNRMNQLRTADIAAVLDAVRETGFSAHPRPGNGDYGLDGIAPIVFAVAVNRGRNPVELQAEVNAYANAQA